MGWLLLFYTLEIFKWLIIVRAVMSWFVSPATDNPLVRAIRTLTDPILRPLSDLLPDMGGVDLSPVVAFFAIVLLQQVVMGMA
ncbi:MAG TPA: YggT family protein [Longimicrobiaceae bacterium]|nr:YggT family protein [Longimicrobiaceae bacterium]